MAHPRPRHFLHLRDLSLDEHERLFARAAELKARRKRHEVETTLAGRTLVCIFEKASTRTRVSFASGMPASWHLRTNAPVAL